MSPDERREKAIEVRRTEARDWPAIAGLLHRVKGCSEFAHSHARALSAKEMEALYRGALNHVARQGGHLVGFCIHQMVNRRVKLGSSMLADMEQKEIEILYFVADYTLPNALEITRVLCHRAAQDALDMGVVKSSGLVGGDCLMAISFVEGTVPFSVDAERERKRVRLDIRDVIEATR